MRFTPISILVFGFSITAIGQHNPPVNRPNIVLIVADDLGFSDLGCYGSEISTPNIDGLANNGKLFASFYTGATCSPTRAMLLSGTDHHIAGLGNMAEAVVSIPAQNGKPGYEGYLNNRVVAVSQLLKDAGYHTYIAGKWHLGLTPDQSPAAKGFERSFTLLAAAENHFYPSPQTNFWEDNNYGSYPSGQYSTDVYTDKLIGYIKSGKKDNKPFFLYAAYTAPHWPLQAPEKYLTKYKGFYDKGYDTLRANRLRGLKRKGIVAPEVKLPALPAVKGNLYNISNRPLQPWKILSKSAQKLEARKMEIYAGMVDNLDYNVGRLLKVLKETGEYDNTFIVFISDNGPDIFEANETPDPMNPYPYMGTANSFIAYGPQWAHAASAVNKLYKGYNAEGGIHCPMIIRRPFQKNGEGVTRQFTTVLDLAPTFIELSGGVHPSIYKGNKIAPYQGSSLIPFFEKKKPFIHDENYIMGWELFGRCALRKGNWKILKIERPFGKGDFALYDLEKDPAESHDLSSQFPDKHRELLAHWNAYVKENGVILVDPR